MWQEQDGGKHDLYTWVHETAGDDNGAIPPQPIYQGALDMGYYNMNADDAPNFQFIGDTYAMSDNYHQGVMGGTGANHIMLGTGDMAYYDDAQGNPATPPSNANGSTATATVSAVSTVGATRSRVIRATTSASVSSGRRSACW